MTSSMLEHQTRATDALAAALRKGSVHHAYLFGGPQGVGKEEAAIAFAQALLCPERAQGASECCGKCSTCRRVAHRNHADVTWVMPEQEQVARKIAGRSDFGHTPSRDIRVEQIRGLQERLALRALEGQRKVAVIVSADCMTTQAQNAFLKTLEEPPAGTVLLLLAAAPDKLLPTLRSRCARVQFSPLPIDFLVARVKAERRVDDATAQLVAVMASGSLSRALELDVEGLVERRSVVEQFESLRAGDSRPWLAFADELGDGRESAEKALRLLSLWLRDVALVKAGSERVANADLLDLARASAARRTQADLHRCQALIQQAQVAVSGRNGAPRLQLERMLIEMFLPQIAGGALPGAPSAR